MAEDVINNKKPIVFSDVDGTIYNNFIPQQETIEDIKFLIENGGDFNICTGNPCFQRMFWLSERLNARYIIGSSGSQIFDTKIKKIIYSKHISNRIFNNILDICKQHEIQMIFWDNENYYYLFDWPINDIIFQYHFEDLKVKKEFPKKYDFEFIEPVKIELYPHNDADQKELNQIYSIIKDLKELKIIQTAALIEIEAELIDKGSAIQWMMSNIYANEETKLEDVMAIGDGNNDVPMIKLTNFGYALANSNQNVHNVAHFYTSSVEQNGVGEAIIDYLYRLKHIVKKYLLHDFKK
ncbi:HAD-IIB family hydrolase [[Mycoplasma] anseris]|uniref:HAD-IIB family hydrolase n=1 Tax=[Mycoplasma] anseris TaxID=92400 RepID=A0A2Z4NCW0_9BACT|nr:HAD-IIB family hydrolase [[Mycoplasma] anseris]AWX69305.1 HAD-IIB family hydrolase [[Mycoplasma] anseris]